MPPKATKGARKAANGYTLPDPLPNGLVIEAPQTKKSWRLGRSIGLGGFGEIYLCSEDTKSPVGEDASLAVKIEPHENGPLFVEMNFYIRAAKPDSVEEFKKARGMKNLGMPVLRGSGSHVYKGVKYRFLVMDRFGHDLQKIFQNGKRLFSTKTSFNLALKILDVLEYIHSKGYVHNDVKAQNLLLGYGRTKENDVYLVDFGLVSKYLREGVHLEYKPDARKAHDGTIEYTSRDAHIGAHSRRSDLEILGYNLAHWMSGTLPWMDDLTNPKTVQSSKEHYMKDIPAFLTACFGENEYPGELEKFLSYVTKLEFDTEPDYEKCRSIFKDGLRKRKYPLDGKLDFAAPKSPVKKTRRNKRKVNDPVARVGKNTRSTPATSPSISNNGESGACTRSGENGEMNDWCWESVLCSDPESLIRQASRMSESEDESPLAQQHRLLEERRQKESLRNPTAAMIEIMKRMEDREKERQQMSWPQQLNQLTKGKNGKNPTTWDLSPNPLTPAMEEVIQMRSKRISFDYDIPITPEPSDEDSGSESDSSHEEYVPSSLKRNSQNVVSKPPLSPVRIGFHEDSCSSTSTGFGGFDLQSSFNEHSVAGITFEAEDDSDEDEFETVILNESILNFLKDDGASVSQQQNESLNSSNKSKNSKRRKGTSKTSNKKSLIATPGPSLPISSKTTFFQSNPTPLNSQPFGSLSNGSSIKARRISIQNDVSPIRNKHSPPFPLSSTPSKDALKKGTKIAQPHNVEQSLVDDGELSDSEVIFSKTAAVNRGRRKLKRQRSQPTSTEDSSKKQRTELSDDVIDSGRSLPSRGGVQMQKIESVTKSKGGSKAVVAASSSSVIRKIAKMKSQKLAVVPEEPAPKISCKSSSSNCNKKAVTERRSRNRRGGESQPWDWGEVLMSNPEKLLRKK